MRKFESSEDGVMSRAEAVFCGAAVGDAKGWLASPGVEGVHMLLEGSDESVSVEAIRKVYKDQEWDQKASLDLKQFTTLWMATVGDGGIHDVRQHEEVLSPTLRWPVSPTQQDLSLIHI